MVNSRFKFRAWEKNLKEIIPVYNIDFEKRMINTDLAWRTFDEVELMQFTGLYDKNVKEIYEWDIVRIKGHAFQRDEKGIGINIDGNYVVKWSDKMELILAPSPESKEGWLLSKNLHYIEVIGNIFEHKHLLEG